MSGVAVRGCGTALVTPFTGDGAVDEEAYRALVDWQLEEGIHFLVPCGSTGEAATLTTEEHLRVVRLAAEQAAGRVPVLGGVNGNDTRATVELAKAVADQGVSHLMVVGPPYNRPPQRGFIAHFDGDRRRRRRAGRPLQRARPDRIEPRARETTLALAEHPNICGIKEASGNMDQILDVILHRPGGASSFCQATIPLTVPMMALGGDGVVSVVSNAVPKPMARLARKRWTGVTLARRDASCGHASADHDCGFRGEQSHADEGCDGRARTDAGSSYGSHLVRPWPRSIASTLQRSPSKQPGAL